MRTIFREMEQWLDQAEENTLLSTPEVADMVMEAIQHRVQIHRWQVFEFVIMPNHVQLFLSVLQGTSKESIEDFKRWTGHQASTLIKLPNNRFWQDEWFDQVLLADQDFAAPPRPAITRGGLNSIIALWNGCAAQGSSPFGESPFRQDLQVRGKAKNPEREKQLDGFANLAYCSRSGHFLSSAV